MKRSNLSIAAAAIALCACAAQPPVPDEQLAVSRAAVEQAQRAQAHDYAAAELRQAQDKLKLAQAALTREDHAQARRLAEQAEVDARLAETKAYSARAQNAVAEVNESIRLLREQLQPESRRPR